MTLERLMTTDNRCAEEKIAAIEDISGAIIGQLQAQALTEAVCGDLEKHAYSVNDKIVNANLRNLSILFAV